MPETIKLDEREQGSSEAEEPVIGATTAAKDHAGTAAPEPEPSAEPQDERPADREAVHEAPPSPAPHEETALQDFADTIVSSLEQAGIAINESEPKADEADGVAHPEEEIDFFNGWGLGGVQELTEKDEIVEEHEDERTPQPFEELLAHQTLSEISEAAAAVPVPDHVHGELSSKHDELADAVQSALLSIYGTHPHAIAAPRAEDLPQPPQASATSAHWASDDNLSPKMSSSITSASTQPLKAPALSHPIRSISGDGHNGAAPIFRPAPEVRLARSRSPQRRLRRSALLSGSGRHRRGSHGRRGLGA